MTVQVRNAELSSVSIQTETPQSDDGLSKLSEDMEETTVYPLNYRKANAVSKHSIANTISFHWHRD